MEKIFYLIRHGLATKKQHYGKKILSAELLPEGILQVNKLAIALKNIPDSLNYSSEIKRCRQTVEIISHETGKQFVFDRRLNEFYHEKFSEFKHRTKSFLDELMKLNNENFLICTHGMVIAAIKNYLTKGKFTFKDRFDYPEAGQMWTIKFIRKI